MEESNKKNTSIEYETIPPSCLVIIDGVGISKQRAGNAYHLAKNLFIKDVIKKYPTSILKTHGRYAGLPPNTVGSSEVGHINLGTGRTIEQDITIINKEIKNGKFFKNKILLKAVRKAKKNGSSLHLMGLLSNGGVHSDTGHLYALLKLAKKENIKKVFVHAFMDGQDVDKKSGKKYLKNLQKEIKKTGIGKIATISGRYYAMDRVERWSRISGVHRAIAEGIDHYELDPIKTIEKYYEQKIYDQFIPPTVFVNKDGNPVAKVQKSDSIVFFNLRSDRARSLTKTFVKPEVLGLKKHNHNLEDLYFVTLTEFGEDLPVHIAYNNSHIGSTLPEVLAEADHIRQLYIAEAEKFPHITYFFHGLSSHPLRNENRIKIDSKNIPTYDLDPSMSAEKVYREIENTIDQGLCEFIGVNFANPDMLGHTGDLKATIKGMEFVDKKVKAIVKKVLSKDGYVFLVSDHGNCDEMINVKTGEPTTSHTKNPVYFSIISNRKDIKLNKKGTLSQVAPSILKVFGIDKPKKWDKDLIIR